jgi:hypothetical protein
LDDPGRSGNIVGAARCKAGGNSFGPGLFQGGRVLPSFGVVCGLEFDVFEENAIATQAAGETKLIDDFGIGSRDT